MGTMTEPAIPLRGVTLHDVDWETYCTLRDQESNNHLRMNYLDGNLFIITPDPIHEEAADLLALVVRGTAAGSGIAIKGLRTTTLRRGVAMAKGSSKDPDNAFYLGAHVELMTSFRKRKKDGRAPKIKLDLNVDPPPDLAIELDHTRHSTNSLPTYARLGVPEVWRYDVDDDVPRFFRLAPDGSYVEVERSVALPKLTPELLIQTLDLLDATPGYDEVAYLDQVRAWARALPEPPEPAR
jgi:Uma2 family endonuclease